MKLPDYRLDFYGKDVSFYKLIPESVLNLTRGKNGKNTPRNDGVLQKRLSEASTLDPR